MGIKADLDLSKLLMWNRQNNVRLRLFRGRRLNSINFFHWRWFFLSLELDRLNNKLFASQIGFLPNPTQLSAEETISIKRVSSYIQL